MSGTINLWQVIEMASADALYYGYCPICDETRHDDGLILCTICGNEKRQCETVGDILDVKRAEPGYSRLYADIRDNGMNTPIYIAEDNGELMVCNGHHRIAICEDLGKTDIPYTRDYVLGFLDGDEEIAVA